MTDKPQLGPPRRGDLVLTSMDGHAYYGIVLKPVSRHGDMIDVFLCNGITLALPVEEIFILPVVHESSSHANFAEILRPES